MHATCSTHLIIPNNIWWSIQVVKFLIMQSSPATHHFLPLRTKYCPQHLFWNTRFLICCDNIFFAILRWHTVFQGKNAPSCYAAVCKQVVTTFLRTIQYYLSSWNIILCFQGTQATLLRNSQHPTALDAHRKKTSSCAITTPDKVLTETESKRVDRYGSETTLIRSIATRDEESNQCSGGTYTGGARSWPNLVA